MYDFSVLLVIEYEAAGMFFTKCWMHHKDAEHAVLFRNPNVDEVVVRYYYRSPVYSSLCDQEEMKKTCRDDVTVLTV